MRITHTTGRDQNGNKTATLRNENTGALIARGIQTNGNAPTAHANGDKRQAVAELATYIYKHGNDTQRQRLEDAGHRATLLDAVHGDFTLDEEDARQISELLGGHHKTRDRIFSVIYYSAQQLDACGIFERVHHCKHSNRWSYCAGQDYTAELATLRNILKK